MSTPDAEIVAFRIRLALMARIRDYIVQQGWTQAEAAGRLGLSQPRVSAIFRGKTDLFTIDRLVGVLAVLGVRVDAMLEAAAWPERTGIGPLLQEAR